MADKTEVIYDLIFNTQAASQDIASLNVQLKTVQDNMTRLSGAGRKASGAIADTGRAFGKTGQSIQNASFQIADFATQVSGGAGVTRALSQQLPQLLAGFGALGAVAGAAVAIFVPLLGGMEDTTKATEALNKAVQDAADAQEQAKIPLDKLTESYGALAPEIAQVNQNTAEFLKLEAQRTLAEFGKASQEATASVDLLGTALDAGSAYISTWATNFQSLQDYINYTQGYTKLQQNLDAISQKFNLGARETELYGGRIQQINEYLANQDFGLAVRAFARLNDQIRKNGDTAIYASAGYIQLGEAAVAAAKLASSGPMGFSFTPVTEATGYSNYEGEAKVAEQLAAIEKRVADQKKAVADAARAAAAAQREQNSAYESFVGTIERGVTPLQRLQDTLRRAEENFAKFKDRMSTEEVAAYTAYIADLNAKIDDLAFKEKWDAMAEGINSATEAMDPFSKAIQDVAQNIQDSFANGLADAFMAFIEGTKSAEEAFKQFATTFLKEITGMIIKSLILFAIQKALGMVGGGLGNILGLGAGIYGNGGVFAGGREVKAFANGGVINGPTLFPTSSGIGLMGEAGPEAIVPLTRRNGKLGVEASPVNVTVINNSSAQVSTRKNADGGVTIEVIEEAVASAISRGGNKIDQAMSRGYGLRRAGR